MNKSITSEGLLSEWPKILAEYVSENIFIKGETDWLVYLWETIKRTLSLCEYGRQLGNQNP